MIKLQFGKKDQFFEQVGLIVFGIKKNLFVNVLD